jgi:hypothetical protein
VKFVRVVNICAGDTTAVATQNAERIKTIFPSPSLFILPLLRLLAGLKLNSCQFVFERKKAQR